MRPFYLFMTFSLLLTVGQNRSIVKAMAADMREDALSRRPGVYAVMENKLLVVGEGKITGALRDQRALRLAEYMATNDAKQRLAEYIFPEDMKKNKRVTLYLEKAQTVSRLHPNEQLVTVAITVNRNDVSLVSCAEGTFFANARAVNVEQEFLELIASDPFLRDGGAKLFSRGDGWLALGVGLSALPTDDSATSERSALRVAQVEASKALAEMFFGNQIEVLESEAAESNEINGIARFREWARRETREKVEGALRNAEMVGRWITDDNHIAIALAVGVPPVNTGKFIAVTNADALNEFTDWDLKSPWDSIIRSQTGLLKGGAVLFVAGQDGWVLGVGSAKLAGNPAHDRINAPRMAEVDAQRQIGKYVSGFSSHSLIVEREGVVIEGGNNREDTASRSDYFRKIGKEHLAASLGGVTCVGGYISADGKVLYRVCVVYAK